MSSLSQFKVAKQLFSTGEHVEVQKEELIEPFLEVLRSQQDLIRPFVLKSCLSHAIQTIFSIKNSLQ